MPFTPEPDEKLQLEPYSRTEVFERGASSKSSQRDCSSSILTSSIVGNRRSFIHEEIKTKRSVRKRNSVTQKAVAKCKVDLPKSRDRAKTKVSKEDTKDDVVYVLQSNGRRDLTASDSFRSKRTLDFDDSMISLQHNDNNSNIPSGIDRIATQILQGWMTDKEKSTKSEGLDKSEGGHNLSLPSTAAAEDNTSLRVFPSSKEEKPLGTVLNSSVKKITFDVPDHTVIPRIPSGQFRTTERDTRKSNKESTRKVPRVKAETVRPKFNKLRAESRTYKAADGTPRKNAKEFLDVIKRELEKCGRIPEEPRSMFDALKMVARNKHLSKKRISSYLSDTDCELQSSKMVRTKLYSNRLKSNSLECPIDSQTKKRRKKRTKNPEKYIANRRSVLTMMKQFT